MEIDSFVQKHKNLLDQRLEQLLAASFPFEWNRELFQSAHYALFPSGKRLRPLLALTVIASAKKSVEPLLTPLCALELLHTYSLIHDDLPCMDNDDFRRGKPSLHKAFSEWLALLTGDFLLTFAFETAVQSPQLSNQQKVDLVAVLARQSGCNGMIGGQYLDLHLEGKKVPWQKIRQMYIGKTSSLLSASLEFGVILAGLTDPKDRLALRKLGTYLGIVYQIQDDLFNATSQQALLGKPVGSDCKRKKANALSLLGEQEAKKTLETFSRLALRTFSSCSFSTVLLQEAVQQIFMRRF
jgi:geranylgeranyl diphosphate synthase, type II